MADLELIHRILKRTKHKNSPRRTVSFTSNYINGEVVETVEIGSSCELIHSGERAGANNA